MTVQDEVQRLLSPIVATVGVELYDVEFSGNTLRVVIEEAEPAVGDDGQVRGITTDRLAQVNRLISPILDQHDPVPGRYTLEVSSPGLERPLRRLAHFTRAVGEEIVVKAVPGTEPRRVKGRLVAVQPPPGTDVPAAGAPPADADPDVDADAVTPSELVTVITLEAAEIDGVELAEPERRELALAQIASARTVFAWGPGPKPGQPKSRPGTRPAPKPAGRGTKAAAPRAAGDQTDHDPTPSSEVCDEQ